MSTVFPILPGQERRIIWVRTRATADTPAGEPKQCYEDSLGYAYDSGYEKCEAPGDAPAPAIPVFTPEDTNKDREDREHDGEDDDDDENDLTGSVIIGAPDGVTTIPPLELNNPQPTTDNRQPATVTTLPDGDGTTGSTPPAPQVCTVNGCTGECKAWPTPKQFETLTRKVRREVNRARKAHGLEAIGDA